jgi:DNA-binding transcriptional ArsR family regulator
MRLSHPLDDLFQNRSHVKVLRALHAVPEGVEVSTREVARRAGITHPTASGVLEDLRTQGVIHVRRTVWADQYRVNPEHVLWQKIRPLLKWERRLPEEVKSFLVDEIRERTPWITNAYLFGSGAGVDNRPDIDIDVAVICPRNRVP